MKRKRCGNSPSPPTNSLVLEEVVGFTTRNGNGLASSISSSKIAYIAGRVVVLYDVRSGTHSYFMAPRRSSTPRPLNCVALSSDASFVAAGELGRQPGILVWDCTTLAFKCELKGHQYGVACLALSPDGKHLVSVGSPRDGCICLWDWKHKILATKFRAASVSSPVSFIEFSSDGKFFVSAGKNHLKFWKVRVPAGSRTRSVSLIMQREFDRGMNKEMAFIAVRCSNRCSESVDQFNDVQKIPFYAVTGKGTLCMVFPDSSAIKMVELKVKKCYAVSVSASWIACACNNGLVNLYSTSFLKYAGSLCYGEDKSFRKIDNVRCGLGNEVEVETSNAFPDAVACQFSSEEDLVVIYDDHSLHIWNISDMPKVTRRYLLTSHSGCIWSILNFPRENKHDSSPPCIAEGCAVGTTFATCAADGDIKLWDLVFNSSSGDVSTLTNYGSTGMFLRDNIAKGMASAGFRSMAISSDGKHIAAGDFQGNVHVFNMETSDSICIQGIHIGEVLSLCFSLESRDNFAFSEESGNRCFLASAGRDGKIHLFDVDRNFRSLGCIDYHKSAVTAVMILQNGREILSFGEHSYLVLHSLNFTDTECKISCQGMIETSGIIKDLALNHQNAVAFAVCQDKTINVIDIKSRTRVNCFKHDLETEEPIKATLDEGCSYLACTSSTRCICIYDCMTGNMVAQAIGNADSMTGVIFLPDSMHLASVSTDGCIFVWKFPARLSSTISRRTENVSIQFAPKSIGSFVFVDHNEDASLKSQLCKNQEEMLIKKPGIPGSAKFEFSLSRLPKWARDKVTSDAFHSNVCSNSSKVSPMESDQCLEFRSPCDDPTAVRRCSRTSSEDLSGTSDSLGSPSLPENFNSRQANNRWLTIHTVCMDLNDSLSTSGVDVVNGNRFIASRKIEGERTGGLHSNKRIKLSCSDPSTNPSDKNEYMDMPRERERIKGSFSGMQAQYSALATPDSVSGSLPKATTSMVQNGVDEPFELETARSCEQALRNTEDAVEKALKSVRQLATICSSYGPSSVGCEPNPCGTAVTTTIPSLQRKVHEIANLLQACKRSTQK